MISLPARLLRQVCLVIACRTLVSSRGTRCWSTYLVIGILALSGCAGVFVASASPGDLHLPETFQLMRAVDGDVAVGSLAQEVSAISWRIGMPYARGPMLAVAHSHSLTTGKTLFRS